MLLVACPKRFFIKKRETIASEQPRWSKSNTHGFVAAKLHSYDIVKELKLHCAGSQHRETVPSARNFLPHL